MSPNDVVGFRTLAAATPAAAVRIAIVDDDKDIRDLAAIILKSAGMIPIQVLPRVADIEALCGTNPDVVLVDLALGTLDAVRVMKILAAAQFRGSVVLMSGRFLQELEEVRAVGEANGLRMLPPLRKPFRKGELVAAVSRAYEPPRNAPEPARIDPAEALARGWLELWYQPKIHLRTGSLCGAEALLRLRHPELGLLGPDRFLPEPSAPTYDAITEFVIRTSARDLASMGAKPLTIAINASINAIQKPYFMAALIDCWIGPTGQPSRLTVEVTETDAAGDMNSAKEASLQLKLHDVGLSIDDFGSGYSSFSRLSEMPFTELKLDRRYVTGCGSDPAKEAICRSAASMCRHFNVTATAEGVESKADLSCIIDAGFELAQGYYFSRPLTLAHFNQARYSDFMPTDARRRLA